LRNIPEPLGQLAPRGFALRITRQPGHLVAIGRVFVKLFRQIHIQFHLAPNRGPTALSNLSAGRLVPEKISMPVRFHACFIGKSHNHTAIIPPRPGNNAGLHQPHRFHQQHKSRHQQQTIRARPTLTTAPEPTGRRGVGLGGTAGPVCWKGLPPNIGSLPPAEKVGNPTERMRGRRDCPREGACPAKVGTGFANRARSNRRPMIRRKIIPL
jgi:hypothetical protein